MYDVKNEAGIKIGRLVGPDDIVLNLGQLLHLEERTPAGTHGGSFLTGAWRTRNINTVVSNTISGSSLSIKQVTLPIGEYYVDAFSVCVLPAAATVFRLFDITNLVTLLSSSSDMSSGAITQVAGLTSIIRGKVVLSDTTTFEMQGNTSYSYADQGFGNGYNQGQTHNIFAQLLIWKL